ncbi:LysR family transcriptional regulator [Pseudoroseomonas cervicalis]|uniref:LysR substrate binding domain protein n=1 Tax=Pseudoroseomonas cervicalis ATCC 49957 TaxID=525371 RepID=D5RLZ0_9PROT|nr:LysR family transcriptional regulator [Pseudoroseomonas cervicalis]EFH11675.1 LysR substrate binding domain protein [Pseudoroseomonas cervicalis ATCC 49957]
MELRQLGCFVAVAEELHFGRAAARLHMLPSALGRQVRQLEEELGTALLARTTRHVALTAAGSALLEEARSLLAGAAAAARRVRALAQEAQLLRLGAIDSAASTLLPPLLSAFRARHPGVETRLTEEKSARLLPMLASGRLDLAFIRTPPAESGLAFLPLRQERLVAALPRGHALARRRMLTARDLVGERLILPPRHSRPHSLALAARLFEEAGLPLPRPAQEAAEKQTIVGLVAAGLGVALVPEWAAQLGARGLVYRPLAAPREPAPEAMLGAAWVEGQAAPARDLFLEVLKEDSSFSEEKEAKRLSSRLPPSPG